MLDRIESGTECCFYAGFLMGMSGHLAAECVRGIGDGAQFLVGELLAGSGCGLAEHAARCSYLDDVRTAFYLAAHGGPASVSAVTDAGRFHDVQNLLAEPMHVPVATRRCDCFARCDDLGAGNLAGLDRVAKRKYGGPPRAKVTYRRKPCQQCAPRIHLGSHHDIRIRLRDRVGLAAAARLPREMHMQIDEARHDKPVGEIDDLNIAICLNVHSPHVTLADFHDLAVFHDDALLGERRVARDCEQLAGVDDGRARRHRKFRGPVIVCGGCVDIPRTGEQCGDGDSQSGLAAKFGQTHAGSPFDDERTVTEWW